MKTKFYQIVFLCIALVGITSAANAQTKAIDYNPFVSGNMGAFETKVVTEGSIHTYTYTGDAALSGSSFVFKVVGGTIITATDNTAPLALIETNGTGTHTVAEVSDKGSIVVLWDNVQAENYVAVYELSANGCINDNVIGGYEITIGAKPFIAIALADDQICSVDKIFIDVTITNGTSPWTLTLNDGADDKTFYFTTGNVASVTGTYDVVVPDVVVDVDGKFTYSYEATGYLYTGPGASNDYTFTVNQFDDAVTLAELNDQGQIEAGKGAVTATVYPLPTIGVMAQD